MLTRSNRGTSLVEVLVVIVILAIGIFAVVRMFPPGFIALERSKEQAMAAQLARQSLEQLKGRRESLPLAIYPVRYRNAGGNLVLEVDADTQPWELGYYQSDDPGITVDPHYVSDVNRVRRIIGESVRVPAPKPVGDDPDDALYFGSLYQVTFAPILYDPSVFVVYGSELRRRWTSRSSATDTICLNRELIRGTEYYVSGQAGAIWLPVSSNRNITWRVNLSYWATRGSQLVRHDIVDLLVTTTPSMLVNDPDCWPPDELNAILGIDLVPLIQFPGEQFHSIITRSVRVARTFTQIGVGDAFSPFNPYEYKLLNDKLGMILLNPSGYDRQVNTARGRMPLVANVDYDVLDWHIIADERRVPESRPHNVKLTLENIKRFNDLQLDQTRFRGLTFPFDGDQRDMVIVDVSDGSEIVNDANHPSYTVDALKGIVRLNEPVFILRPGSNQPVARNPAGRTYRFLYMAHDDWGRQVQKAAHRYQIVWNVNTEGRLGVSQAYIGGSGDSRLGLPTRVYFPLCDVGKKVVVREYRYLTANNSNRVAKNEDFVIHPPHPADDLQIGYIDISEDGHHPDAVGFDWNASASPVQGIQGTSVLVRVVWAPEQRERSAAERQNSYPDVRYLPVWKKVDYETHLTKEVVN